MVSTSTMLESIAFHITRHDSPVSYASAKENAQSQAKHSSQPPATKVSKLSVAQMAKELAMEQRSPADSTSQDVVLERHVYVSHSGTSLDGHSSTDSCSAGPSRASRKSHGTDVLGRSLKDAMVIDFGVMTVMCFAGNPLKRDDTFDRSVISGNEDASLITIQNRVMETPETSPRASPIHLPDPKVISIKTRNSQDRALSHLSALHVPLTAMFAQHQVLTVISDEGPDDEDIELNCNVEPSTEIHHAATHQNRVDTYPHFFSSDSKSPSVTSTLTSGSVSFIHQKIAVTIGEEQDKSILGDIVLKKNPSLTYAHGCFPSQAHTNLDSSSHGSSADGNSTASTTPSTTLTSLVDNPVVTPSTWNDLFCNMNAGIQIFDFDDPDSPLVLGCISPTAAQVESKTRHGSKSKLGDMALDSASAKSNGGGISWTCEEHKEPSLLCEESIEDLVQKTESFDSNNESGAPHPSSNCPVKERNTFETILSNVERLTAFERVGGDKGDKHVCDQHENQVSCHDDFDQPTVQETESIEELETTTTEESFIHQISESVESISFQDARLVHATAHESEASRNGASDKEAKTQDETTDALLRSEKEEEEAIRKAYYLHRRQLYLESHAKSISVAEPKSFDDNDSEERPFDCGGPTKPTASKSARSNDHETGTHASNPRPTVECSVSLSALSADAAYRYRKCSPRHVTASESPTPKSTLDEPLSPQRFATPEIIEHPLLQQMAKDQRDKHHTMHGAPSSSDSTSSHLKIPSHPGSSEERTSLVGTPKSPERSERTLIVSPTNDSAQSRHQRVNEGISPTFGKRSNALRLTDPGNRSTTRQAESNATCSKGNFETTIDSSLTADAENRHPHHRMVCPRSKSDSSTSAQKKATTPLAIDSAGKNSPRACNGTTSDSWNTQQQKSKTTQYVDGRPWQLRRQSLENLGITEGHLHRKSTVTPSISDSGRSNFQRTTIASLAADSGISNRFVISSNLATDSGSSHHRTASFGSSHDRASNHNKSASLNLSAESGSSGHDSRTVPSDSSSSHHRRTDRLNYLKMVRGVKIATRHLQ